MLRYSLNSFMPVSEVLVGYWYPLRITSSFFSVGRIITVTPPGSLTAGFAAAIPDSNALPVLRRATSPSASLTITSKYGSVLGLYCTAMPG